jgi:hypothetical protein
MTDGSTHGTCQAKNLALKQASEAPTGRPKHRCRRAKRHVGGNSHQNELSTTTAPADGFADWHYTSQRGSEDRSQPRSDD